MTEEETERERERGRCETERRDLKRQLERACEKEAVFKANS